MQGIKINHYYCTYRYKDSLLNRITFGTNVKHKAIQEYLELLSDKSQNINELKIWLYDGVKRIDYTTRLNKYLRKRGF